MTSIFANRAVACGRRAFDVSALEPAGLVVAQDSTGNAAQHIFVVLFCPVVQNCA